MQLPAWHMHSHTQYLTGRHSKLPDDVALHCIKGWVKFFAVLTCDFVPRHSAPRAPATPVQRSNWNKWDCVLFCFRAIVSVMGLKKDKRRKRMKTTTEQERDYIDRRCRERKKGRWKRTWLGHSHHLHYHTKHTCALKLIKTYTKNECCSYQASTSIRCSRGWTVCVCATKTPAGKNGVHWHLKKKL